MTVKAKGQGAHAVQTDFYVSALDGYEQDCKPSCGMRVACELLHCECCERVLRT